MCLGQIERGLSPPFHAFPLSPGPGCGLFGQQWVLTHAHIGSRTRELYSLGMCPHMLGYEFVACAPSVCLCFGSSNPPLSCSFASLRLREHIVRPPSLHACLLFFMLPPSCLCIGAAAGPLGNGSWRRAWR